MTSFSPIENLCSNKDSSARNHSVIHIMTFEKKTISRIMTEPMKESLFDKLLKSRYPLTRYLSRQQQFLANFSTTSASSGTILFFQKDPSYIYLQNVKRMQFINEKLHILLLLKWKVRFSISSINRSFSFLPLPFRLAYDASNGMINNQDCSIAYGK